jgi:hypothetical protein
MLNHARCHRYTPEEILYLKDNIAGRSYNEMTNLFNKHFGLRGKKKFSFVQIKGALISHGIANGRSGRFLPGYTSPNRKPVGSECTGGGGYIVVKIADPELWRYKHIVVWEKAHGSIPKGHVIMFADGNKKNLRLSNLVMVSKKEIGVMNRCGLISTHKDLTIAGKLVADIKILIAERKRGMKKRTGKRRRQNEKGD